MVDNTLQKSIDGCNKRLESLKKKYLGEANLDGSLMTDEEFKSFKAEIEAEKASLEAKLASIAASEDDWLSVAEKSFDFATQARYWFKHGTREQKREIVKNLGLNLKLVNKTFCYDLQKPLLPIKEANKYLCVAGNKFEPKEFAYREGKFVPVDGVSLIWGG